MASWAQSCSSVMRSFWERGFSSCCRSEEEEGEQVEMVVIKDELVEVQEIMKDTDEDNEEKTKEIAEGNNMMKAIMEENIALKAASIIEKQALEEEKLYYQKQQDQAAKTLEEEIERADASEIEKNNALEILAAKQDALDNLRRDLDNLADRYKNLFENPCPCFYAKHTDEILYQRYNSAEDGPPSVDGVESTADLVPRVINDIEGFLPIDDNDSGILYTDSEPSNAGYEANAPDENDKEETKEVVEDAPAGVDEDLWWLPEDMR